MNDDRAHVRLRMGDLEVEYEGAASFLKSELLDLVREMAGLHVSRAVPSTRDESSRRPAAPDPKPAVDMSMEALATKLSAAKGPDLVIAAVAFMTLMQGRDVVPRKDILATMKTAPAFYKESMSGNLSKALQSLLKQNRLNQTSGGQYALTATEKQKLNAALIDDS